MKRAAIIVAAALLLAACQTTKPAHIPAKVTVDWSDCQWADGITALGGPVKECKGSDGNWYKRDAGVDAPDVPAR